MISFCPEISHDVGPRWSTMFRVSMIFLGIFGGEKGENPSYVNMFKRQAGFRPGIKSSVSNG